MIRTLRAFFLSRLLREKLLLVAFVVLGVLMWLSSFGGRLGKFWRQQAATTSSLNDQKQWLDNRASIEAAAKSASDRFDRARTLNGTRLFAEVEQLARDAGLTFNLGEPRDEKRGEFATIHSVQITMNRAEWPVFLKFYQALLQRAPYISIEQCTISMADRGTAPNTPHNVSLRVSSFDPI